MIPAIATPVVTAWARPARWRVPGAGGPGDPQAGPPGAGAGPPAAGAPQAGAAGGDGGGAGVVIVVAALAAAVNASCSGSVAIGRPFCRREAPSAAAVCGRRAGSGSVAAATTACSQPGTPGGNDGACGVVIRRMRKAG
jgi:hypothetical protein